MAVQFLAAKDGLETEAIECARMLEDDNVAVRVMAREYLVILYTLTGGSKRRIRAHDLIAAEGINLQTLQEIIMWHNLTSEWQREWNDERQ